MALFGRRDQPPAEIVAAVGIDDRVVSWAHTNANSVIAASRRGLWWPDRDGPRLINWHLIDKVIWDHGAFSVTEAEVVDDGMLVDRPAVTARLTVPRDLPPIVRKRVEANIVRNDLLTVPGGAVRFVARRVAGRDGVEWWARLEPGTPNTEQVRSAIRARLARLRASDAVR